MNIHFSVTLTVNVLYSSTNYITQCKITLKVFLFMKRHKISIKNSHQVSTYTWLINVLLS